MIVNTALKTVAPFVPVAGSAYGFARIKSAIRDGCVRIKCDKERTRRESCTSRKMVSAKTFTEA